MNSACRSQCEKHPGCRRGYKHLGKANPNPNPNPNPDPNPNPNPNPDPNPNPNQVRGGSAQSSRQQVCTLGLEHACNRPGAELVGACAVGWVAALPMPTKALTRSHMRAPHHMHHTHRSLARRRTATQARPRRPRRHCGHGGGGGGGERGGGSILFGQPRERHGRPGCESGGGLLGRSEPPRASVPRESASATCCAQDAGATQTDAGDGRAVNICIIYTGGDIYS